MRHREWVRGSENVRTQSSEGTSHQPYEKRHVEGTGETWSSSLPPGVDLIQSQSQCQGKGNDSGRRGRRCQHETPKASPVEGAEGVAIMKH